MLKMNVRPTKKLKIDNGTGISHIAHLGDRVAGQRRTMLVF